MMIFNTGTNCLNIRICIPRLFQTAIFFVISLLTSLSLSKNLVRANTEPMVAIKEMYVVDRGYWSDALDALDIDADGDMDLISGGGHPEEVYSLYIYEQISRGIDWRRHKIYEGPGRIQGAAMMLTRSGRLVAASADQINGYVRLHVRPPGADWNSFQSFVIVENVPWIQSLVPIDLDQDGQMEFVFAWEGNTDREGGIGYIKLVGDNPLDRQNWIQRTIANIDGAWGLRVTQMLDLNGDGQAKEILISSRRASNGTRNQNATSQLHYVEMLSIESNDWRLSTIAEIGPDTTNFDVGHFFGHDRFLDIAAIDMKRNKLYILRGSEQFKSYEYPFPNKIHNKTVASMTGWNISTVQYPRHGQNKDSLIVVTADNEKKISYFYIFSFKEELYDFDLLYSTHYGHPIDNRILWVDVNGDGNKEVVLPDSGGHKLMWWGFADWSNQWK